MASENSDNQGERRGAGRTLAVALEVADQPVLVAGGGAVAERKVATLLDCGARVTIVAPQVTPRLGEWSAAGRLTWLKRGWQPGDGAGARLVFAATDQPAVNAAVAAEAAVAGVWCNVASPPAAGDCQVLAAVQQGGVTIAIGTAGASPLVARKLRELVERTVPTEVGRLVELMGELREQVQAQFGDEATRRAVYESMWSSPALARLQAGDETGARAALRACCEP